MMPDAYGLTTRQADVLAFIRRRLGEGISPSYQEIQDALGLKSKSGVARLVRGLVDRGRIRQLPYRGRSIELVEGPPAPAPAEDARRVQACVAACDGVTMEELEILGPGGVRRLMDLLALPRVGRVPEVAA